MTDRYENIRKALAMGPTPGPWEFNKNPKEGECPLVYGPNQTPLMDHISDEAPPDYFERWVVRDADAAHIAACDPDTARALLEERDGLTAENARLREERDALLDALRQIAQWPDGGDRYGQENIKRFAQAAIDAAIDRARGKAGQEVGK